MPTYTGDELLDLEDTSGRRIAGRHETVRFDVLDSSNALIGTLDVDDKSTPEVRNDVARTICRTLSGVVIDANVASDINTVTDRLRPTWVVAPGGAGYEWTLGVFLFGDASRTTRTYGEDLRGSLVDQLLILDQLLTSSVSYAAGTNIGDALTAQAAAAGIIATSIESTSLTISAAIGWVAGHDKRLKVMADLCAMAGFLSPYFDNDGVLVCRAAPDLASAAATRTYGLGTRILDDTIVASDDLLTAPNVYLATDTGATDAPIVGRFDIPASAPHSFANRGFYVPAEPVELQGLTDTDAANAAAAAAYAQDSSSFRWLSFDSTPDPRHDTFDIVAVDAVNYREQAWALRLESGGTMHHELRGIY